MVKHIARVVLSDPFPQLLPLTLLVGLLLLCSADASGAELAKDEANKKVLIFSSYEPVSPGSIIVSQSFTAILRKDSTSRVRFYHEFLDNSRISESNYEAIMVGLLRQKYEAEQLDLISVLGVPALEFLLRHEADLFLHTPKVFCFFEETEAFAQGLRPGVTGIRAKIEYSKTLEVALSLHPETEQVFVVAGSSGQDRFLLAEADKEFRKYQGRVEFTYLYDMTVGELQQKLATLPNNSIVMFLSFFFDSAGNSFSGPQGAALVASSSIAPVYSIAKTYLGSGIVGGSLLDFEAIGDQVGEIGLRILGGQRPEDIAQQAVPNVTMFDWRELRRRGISESRLPAGSIVEFKEPSFWEQYKWYIVAIIGAGCIEALLVAGLLINRARRRKAEKESHRLAQLAEAERRKLDEVISNMPGVVCETRADHTSGPWKIVFISEYIEKLLGYSVEQWLSAPDFVKSIICEEDREAFTRQRDEILASRQEGNIQFRWRTKDGRVLWAESYMYPILDEAGAVTGLRGVTLDITNHKRAEEELRQSEERLLLAQRAANIGTWDWNLVTGESTWSEGIYNLLGLEPGDGNAAVGDFIEFIHPEDLERALSHVESAVGEGEAYYDEFRIIRRDSSILWLASRGSVVRDDSGRVERMIGVNIDITERKQAEESLKETLARMSELKSQLEAENIYLQEEILLEHEFDEIIGNSEAIRKVLLQIERVAHTNMTVLILGETGTGKELVARAIHKAGTRSNKPLIKVNCAALPATLIESELFGHERGAFTSATARQLGRFEMASGGTIFLDEIGDLPLELQGKLLRVLEEGEFERLGSGKTIKVYVRVIAATNRDLQAEIKKGTFREDLWYRLNVFPIVIPPLRMRKEDIPLLIQAFARKFSKEQGKAIKGISPAMMKDLQDYFWPGNIRELANVIERAVINTEGDILRLADNLDPSQKIELPFARQTLEDMERRYILQILEETGGRIEGPRGAARIVGLNPSTLRTRMAKLGIRKSQGEPPLNPLEEEGEPSG